MTQTSFWLYYRNQVKPQNIDIAMIHIFFLSLFHDSMSFSSDLVCLNLEMLDVIYRHERNLCTSWLTNSKKFIQFFQLRVQLALIGRQQHLVELRDSTRKAKLGTKRFFDD